MEIQTLNPATPRQRQRIEAFLKRNGLRINDMNYYAAVLDDDGEMIAGGGLKDDVIKCVAVDDAHKGEAIANTLVSHLISHANQEGYSCIKLFTKPKNRQLFESLSFRLLAEAPEAILMETGIGGIRNTVEALKKIKEESEKYKEYNKECKEDSKKCKENTSYLNTSTPQHLNTTMQPITTSTSQHLTIHPLYGNLSPEDQRRAIAPSAPGERKIVIATPIAETSITIEGVRVVIDAGLCRQVVFDARTGLSHLETVRISMDMATQRMGRAGRVAEGVCYRLWTKTSEHLMAEQRKTEIEEADLAPMVLDTAAFGESDAETLPWLTMPPRAGVFKAKELLTALGAIDENGNITSIGKRMATLPCHPRIARMILATTNLTTSTPQGVHLSQVHQQHLTTSTSHHNNTSLACDIAALLEEKDPLSETGGTDLTLRLSALRAARRKKQLGKWQRIAKIAAEYRRMAHTDEDNRDPAPTEAGLLVAYAYPERIAHSTNSIGGYRLASGANVQLDAADQQSAHSWLAIASLYSAPGTTGRVFLAAPIAPDDLEKEFVKEVDNIAWDTKQGCVVMQREQRIGKLMLSQKPIHDADKERLKGIVCEAMKKDGLTMMAWSEKAVEQVQRRVAQVAAWHPELALPDVSTEHLLSTAADWLPLYLEEGGRVKTSVQELRKLNLADIIWNILPYEAQLEVDRLAPTHIEVPTGSHIRIDYRSGAEAPVLSVRLQECFGMERTPCVDDGRQPLLMELLSPCVSASTYSRTSSASSGTGRKSYSAVCVGSGLG